MDWSGVMFLSDSHSDGTHSLQSIHWLSFWRHPFTAEHPLTLILTAPIHCRASIDSHSDGTHSLQSIHCWDTDAVLHISKSDEETNSSTSWIILRWEYFQLIFIFRWTIPLMAQIKSLLIMALLYFEQTSNLKYELVLANITICLSTTLQRYL